MQVREHFFLGQRIAVAEFFRTHGGRRKDLTACAVRGGGEIQIGGERRLCRLGIHRRMECNAALTQRLIEERRENEHEECRLECHHAIEQT